MALIPLVLEFRGVARDSNLLFVLTTKGATWSIGSDGGDSTGFSYNAVTASNAQSSCIHTVELTESVLSIRTSATAATGTFTLTLFVQVSDSLTMIQGYCTLNADARVRAQFGYGAPMDWQSGSISAVLPRTNKDYRRIGLAFSGAKSEQPMRIQLMTDSDQPGKVRWSFGPASNGAATVSIGMADNSVCLMRSFNVTSNEISLMCGSSGSAADLMIQMYLQQVMLVDPSSTGNAQAAVSRVYLRAECSQSVTVVAKLGNNRPQYLTNTYKAFVF